MIRKVQQRAQQIVSGFKSPADDYLEGRLDISDVLVVDPHCTFYFRMDGNAMSSYCIPDGALLVVDRSLRAIDGAIIITPLHGQLVCKSLSFSKDRIVKLTCDTGEVTLRNNDVLEVWGVVIAVCYNVLPKGLQKGRYRRVCAM
ncbi:S24 family peptidase [Sphingobacterium corticis]|uniref:S24 family peptidase n=1 Tax=Sphingobacterium corticis TaxID=1812823 RepID=A0ABW5NJI1_9SPHI